MASKFTKPYTDENTNFARISCIVVELFRDILWDFLSSKIHPSELPAKVVENLNELHQLRSDLRAKFQDYNERNMSPTRTDVDVSAMYCLIRNLLPRSELEPPANGWGASPRPHQIEIADDVERLRLYRNKLIGHVSTAAIPDTDYQQHIEEIQDISIRFGDLLSKDYVECLKTYLSCDMDPVKVDKVRDLLLKQIECDKETRTKVLEVDERVTDLEQDVEIIKGGLDKLQCSHDEFAERQNEDRKLIDGIQSKVDMQAAGDIVAETQASEIGRVAVDNTIPDRIQASRTPPPSETSHMGGSTGNEGPTSSSYRHENSGGSTIHVALHEGIYSNFQFGDHNTMHVGTRMCDEKKGVKTSTTKNSRTSSHPRD